MYRPRVVVLGSKQAFLDCLPVVLDLPELDLCGGVTIDDSADGRTMWPQIEEAATTAGFALATATKPGEAYDAVLAHHPDLVLVAGWYHIIPPRVLAAVPRGLFGLHFSLLPAYRGAAPVVWAMLRGDKQIGWSIFQLASEVDDGPLAAQGVIEVSDDMYVENVLAALTADSSAALRTCLVPLANGRHPLREQSASGASYSAMRVPADGRIRWSDSGEHVARAVRAQSRPYPGAYCSLGPVELTVWRADIYDGAELVAVPGHVTRFLDGYPVIACGSGSGIVLREIEIRGGDAVNHPAEVIRSVAIRLS